MRLPLQLSPDAAVFNPCTAFSQVRYGRYRQTSSVHCNAVVIGCTCVLPFVGHELVARLFGEMLHPALNSIVCVIYQRLPCQPFRATQDMLFPAEGSGFRC